MARRSLDNRWRGYELSGTEMKLIFENDNIGFVRYNIGYKTKAYLDPSPFKKTPKREVYVFECENLPKEGELIEVITLETDEKNFEGPVHNCIRVVIKYVKDWRKLSPNKYIQSKAMKRDEYTDFFGQPFRGNNKNSVEDLSFCMALSTVSSPMIGANGKGGIDTGIFGKKDVWSSYKDVMGLIPSDFKRAQSKYYYNQTEKDALINPVNSKEINMSLLTPKSTAIHIPILVDGEVRRKSQYKENVLYQIPIIRAYMLDTLLFEPQPASEKVEKRVVDMIHSILNKVSSTQSMACNIDVSSTASKLSSAFARLKLSDVFTEADVIECGDIWLDMYHHSLKIEKAGIDVDHLFKLRPDEFRLYQELQDMYGLEEPIPMSVLKDVKSVEFWLIEETFDILRKKGIVYCPNMETFRLIDFKM
ncbi:hypothetical protein Mpsy_2293 [Methanolobus psychrophilus R15]|nr:hypothetical protein Mpsy_2293 [Methanolobus psychrophilus R15]